MPQINIINYKTKGPTMAYLFATLVSNKSTTTGNISVFEDLVIDKFELKKEDPRFLEDQTI